MMLIKNSNEGILSNATGHWSKLVPYPTSSSPHARCQLDRVCHLSTAHASCSLYITSGYSFSTSKLLLHLRGSRPHMVIWATRANAPNGVSISSAVFAGHIKVTDRPCHIGSTMPHKKRSKKFGKKPHPLVEYTVYRSRACQFISTPRLYPLASYLGDADDCATTPPGE